VHLETRQASDIIPDDSWEGDLGEMYPKVVDPTYGRVDHILAVHSLNPRSMAAHQALYASAMASTATLRKVEIVRETRRQTRSTAGSSMSERALKRRASAL
jgi:hypothetical protein